jgi:hypothetical protein
MDATSPAELLVAKLRLIVIALVELARAALEFRRLAP